MKLIFLSVVLLASTVNGDKGERRRRKMRGSRRTSTDPLERASRGLVPQLMSNYSGPEMIPARDVSCSMATLACANRDGCGLALEQYLLSCSDLVQGEDDTCSRQCQLSLIALLSTPEGERLMECQCEDDGCLRQKQRIEPCRSEVTWNTRPDTVVTCTTATWICAADVTCATAMDYYNRNCQKMFRGEKCSRRCKNSLDIMLRQPAAAKLATCYCEGNEDFECINIRRNTDVLCFGKKDPQDIIDNSIDVDEKPPKASSASSKRKSFSFIIFSFLVTFALTSSGSAIRESILFISNVGL